MLLLSAACWPPVPPVLVRRPFLVLLAPPPPLARALNARNLRLLPGGCGGERERENSGRRQTHHVTSQKGRAIGVEEDPPEATHAQQRPEREDKDKIGLLSRCFVYSAFVATQRHTGTRSHSILSLPAPGNSCQPNPSFASPFPIFLLPCRRFELNAMVLHTFAELWTLVSQRRMVNLEISLVTHRDATTNTFLVSASKHVSHHLKVHSSYRSVQVPRISSRLGSDDGGVGGVGGGAHKAQDKASHSKCKTSVQRRKPLEARNGDKAALISLVVHNNYS